MPSQNVRPIPPYAILDPDRCLEIGRPIFAWHPQSGRPGVNGGGIAVSRGAYPVRAALDSAATWSAGSLRNLGDAGNHFAHPGLWEVASGGGLTLWGIGAFETDSITSPWLSCLTGSALQGWELDRSSANAARMVCCGAASKTFIGNETVNAASGIVTLMGTMIVGVSWGGLYVNGRSQTNTGGAAAPTAPTYATGLGLNCTGASRGLGAVTSRLYGALIWNRQLPQRAAEMLDADPALMWWWPGKSKGRSFSLPAAAAGFQPWTPWPQLGPLVAQ